MRYLVMGSVNIDSFFFMDHIVVPGETQSSLSARDDAGGKGANQAVAMARAGLRVSFAGKCGEDARWILSKMEGYGVDTSLTHVSSDTPTGRAFIQVEKSGQNSIVLLSGGNGMFTSDDIGRVLSGFGKGDVIVLQNEINAIGEIIDEAKSRGLRVVFNPSPFSESIRELPLEEVDMYFINEVEAASLAGWNERPRSDEEFRKLAEELSRSESSKEIVMTCGKHGAYHIDGGKIAYSPIVDAEVVDTTGAGDTFTGFFLRGRDDGMSPEDALKLASRASAVAVSRRGAMASMPCYDEIAD